MNLWVFFNHLKVDKEIKMFLLWAIPLLNRKKQKGLKKENKFHED